MTTEFPAKSRLKLFSVFLLLILLPQIGWGQLQLTDNSTRTIDFSATITGVNNGAFNGTGFSPSPDAGQLNSNAWAVTGWTDGALNFGGTAATASTDYSRGTASAAISTGGMYAYTGAPASAANPALLIQPGGNDWAPGTLTLRIQNNTGQAITSFSIAYDLFVRNDQARSNSFNFSYSDDNTTYHAVSALDYTSPAAADANGLVQIGSSPSRSTTINGLSIANGDYFYIRWSGADAGGTGSRDEFMLDNISITPASGQPPVTLSAPVASAATNITATGFTANWSTVSSASSYRLDVSSLADFSSFVAGYEDRNVGNVTSFDVSGLQSGTDYYYRLRATDGANTSVNSNVINLTTSAASTCTANRIYFQGFETNNNWTIVSSSAGAVSTATGSSDTPDNQRLYAGSSSSWQTNNKTNTLELAFVDVSNYSDKKVRLRLSSTSGTTTNGAEASDSVAAYVAVNGGAFPAKADVVVTGQNNIRYGYSATGIATGTAGTPSIFTPASGGNNTAGYSLIEITLPASANSVALKVVAKNNDSNEIWNVDDIEVLGCETTPCSAPVTAANSISFPNVQQTSMVLNWTKGNGDRRVVVARKDNAITAAETPVNGFTYTANATFGSAGSAIGNGYVVYEGTDETVTVTGLENATTYHFAVFEYNCAPAKYKTDQFASASQTTTACSRPTIASSALTTPVVKDDKINLKWTNGNGTERIVLAKQGSAISPADLPSDNLSYTYSSTFGNGAAIGDAFVVYKGTADNASVTGLTANTAYYFAVVELACTPELYQTAAYAAASATTLPAPMAMYSFNGAAGNENTAAADAAPADVNASVIGRTTINPSNFANTFSATNFPGGTAFDAGSYFSFTVTPAAFHEMTLERLEVDLRRSGTGPADWAIRSSLDNFTANLAQFSLSSSGSFEIDNEAVLGSAFANLTTSVEFRIYGYRASGSGGTGQVDNIQIFGTTTQLPPPATTLVQFKDATRTVNEGDGTITVELTIAGESATVATTVDVVLLSGSAADVNNYTTQTVAFPAGSNANQSVTFTLTDDQLNEGTETLVFGLQNFQGGNQAEGGTQITFELKIIDNELPEIYINEFHYNNAGADVGEFVEIVAPAAFTDLTSITLTLYNGSNGTSYGTYTLENFSTNNQNYGGYRVYSLLIPNIQNGDPDGFSLDYAGQLIEFISYGGTFTAANGPAQGATSADVGFTETEADPVGTSIYLTEGGNPWVWAKQTTGNTIGQPNFNQPLPVELIRFTAVAEGQVVQLKWATASEKGSGYFEVERATAAMQFEAIAKVKGAGNAASVREYAATDRMPLAGASYYRLKQVDQDGAVAYSPVVAVQRKVATEVVVYPNPVREVLHVHTGGKTTARAEVMNLLGQVVLMQVLNSSSATLDVSALPAGTYHLIISTNENNSVHKFVKVQ